MSENIKKLMNEKQHIYNKMLYLLEQQAKQVQRGGGSNWTPKILGTINMNTDMNQMNNITSDSNNIAYRLNGIMISQNGITLSQAMENSFSRILKNNSVI